MAGESHRSRRRVLVLEPFFGGSHRAFVEGLARHLHHGLPDLVERCAWERVVGRYDRLFNGLSGSAAETRGRALRGASRWRR